MIAREPIAALRPFVVQLWASGPVASAVDEARRERILPTGCAHLVLRPDAPKLCVLDVKTRAVAAELSSCVLAGPRSIAYERSFARGVSVGAVLRAGAAQAILGSPLSALVDAHFDARDVLGQPIADHCERIAGLTSAHEQLAELEAFLLARITRSKPTPALVREAVLALDHDASTPIEQLVAKSSVSHRHFCALFEAHVGMTPKRFARVRRFDHAARALAHERSEDISAVAARLGFSDQSHLTREFAVHSAITPSAYQRAAPRDHRHVPLDELGQISSRRTERRDR